MTDTTKVQNSAAVSVTAGMEAAEREEYYARRRRTTSIVVSVGLILVVALFIFMVTRPAADDTVPTSIGVSFNSFFQTLGSLGPIVQIPIVLLVFGSTRLPKLARSMGQASREFREGTREGAGDHL